MLLSPQTTLGQCRRDASLLGPGLPMHDRKILRSDPSVDRKCHLERLHLFLPLLLLLLLPGGHCEIDHLGFFVCVFIRILPR